MMAKICLTLTLLCVSLSAQAQSVNPVVQWNRTLLVLVRTTGAQPATIHPTRSFAIMHAAIYDAVNAIDGTHSPYVVDLPTVSVSASQDAAAAAAAHAVLSPRCIPPSRPCLMPNSSSRWPPFRRERKRRRASG
jgi:hypothetical protein